MVIEWGLTSAVAIMVIQWEDGMTRVIPYYEELPSDPDRVGMAEGLSRDMGQFEVEIHHRPIA
jgi:hypothetical protein